MGGQRLKVCAAELQEQRAAAERGEDYTPRVEKMAEFKSEEQSAPAPSPLVNSFGCSKCGRVFPCKIALTSHERSHDASVKEKDIFLPKPAPPPKTTPEWICIVPTTSATSVVVSLAPLHEAAAKARTAREAQKERERLRSAEADRRLQLREAEAEVDKTERRRGSNARRSYTAKQKLQILEWYDERFAAARHTVTKS